MSICFGDLGKANFRIEIDVAVGKRNIDALFTQGMKPVADQALPKPLALLAGCDGNGRKDEHLARILVEKHARENNTAQNLLIFNCGEDIHLILR